MKWRRRTYHILVKARSDSVGRPRIHKLHLTFFHHLFYRINWTASEPWITAGSLREMFFLLFSFLLDVLLEGFKLLIKGMRLQSWQKKVWRQLFIHLKCDFEHVTKPLPMFNFLIYKMGIAVISIPEGYKGW